MEGIRAEGARVEGEQIWMETENGSAGMTEGMAKSKDDRRMAVVELSTIYMRIKPDYESGNGKRAGGDEQGGIGGI